MIQTSASDLDTVRRHRIIWEARPELRVVYREWFAKLLSYVSGLKPIVEIGSGPGFLKEFSPALISTDVIHTPHVDLVCDGSSLPFRTATVGALVMVDVLHHLPHPLQFMKEAARVLKLGGRIAALEPWITPLSYFLYRWFHHEECRLDLDLERPFLEGDKNAFDGNSALPFELLRHRAPAPPALQLIEVDRFLGLPYLATLGFKRTRPLPQWIFSFARFCERLSVPLRGLAATRAFVTWEQMSRPIATVSGVPSMRPTTPNI